MENLQEILAKNLRLARQHEGVSQEDLAGAANVDRTYVSGIERGLRNPTISVVGRFADVLNTNAASLLTKDAFSKK
tara:strand:+ start:369 stop:596 length:228 start_codon:yes stop_codon:yes gene_type:complete